MSIADIIETRDIREVLHFTTNRGIVGVLASGELLSRFRLPQEKYLEHVLHLNAAIRPEASQFFDKSQNWLDYVNLSISEINSRYFNVSSRWHHGVAVWWGILAFDAEMIAHPGVVFATTNNSYEHCIRQDGPDGLNGLFVPRVYRKGTWAAYRLGRRDALPTCEQAEVLYPSSVPIQFLRRIYVMEGEHYDLAVGWLREFGLTGVEVIVSPDKFLGSPN